MVELKRFRSAVHVEADLISVFAAGEEGVAVAVPDFRLEERSDSDCDFDPGRHATGLNNFISVKRATAHSIQSQCSSRCFDC